MRRSLPLGATLLTLVMVPVLIGLGIWQLERREWKHALIAQLEAAATLPPVSQLDFSRAKAGTETLQYRRAQVDCHPGRVAPYDLKGGTSADDDGGFLVLVDCNDPSLKRKPDLVVVAGWTVRPDAVKTIAVDTKFSGTLIEHPYGDAPGRPQFMLIPTSAVPPLQPSRIPTPDDLPDSHMSYALQWFQLRGDARRDLCDLCAALAGGAADEGATMTSATTLTIVIASLLAAPAVAAPRPDQVAFRALYQELVETDTTLSAGSCTLAAERMAARLRSAGYPDADLHPFAADGHPKEGGLVAVLHGSDPKAQPMLLLRAHRRRRGQARGLGARSVQAGRGERLFLRPRVERRQGLGRGLRRHIGPL